MLSKKIISMMIVLAALVSLSSNSFAQNLPGDKAGRSADMLYRKLNLSTDQYNKVYSSLLDYYTKQGSKTDAKMWETEKSNIGNILNKDQMGTYSSMSERSIMNPVMRKRPKTITKTTETSSSSMTKDNTKKMEDVKKDQTKKMEDVKKDASTKKGEKKSTDKK
ncbi:MAG: hypothetical protein ABI462_05800 [Ignavibacteria bacterium]